MESSISISGRWGKVKQVVLGDLVSAVHYSRWLKSTLIEAGWAPCLVFIVHVFVHVTFNAYEAYPPLDRPVHFPVRDTRAISPDNTRNSRVFPCLFHNGLLGIWRVSL